jgi:hypothetical protein
MQEERIGLARIVARDFGQFSNFVVKGIFVLLHYKEFQKVILSF